MVFLGHIRDFHYENVSRLEFFMDGIWRAFGLWQNMFKKHLPGEHKIPKSQIAVFSKKHDWRSDIRNSRDLLDRLIHRSHFYLHHIKRGTYGCW